MKYVFGAVILIVLLAVYLTGQTGDQDTVTGTVTHVRDGDTIEVAKLPVRLNGVAAPELNEPHGQEAKTFMARLVSRKTVRCDLNGERNGDRVIGICFLNGQDIGETIISAGLARDCPRYSKGRYDDFNTAASKRLPLPGYCNRR